MPTTLGLDWCPAAAALLTCTLLRIDIGTIGWRWRPWRWQILAYAAPLLFCLIGYVAVWAAGLGGFPNGKTVDSLKAALGIPSLSTSQVILLWTFLSLIAGLLGLSVIMLWLRLRSGSVWTGALVHASINLWNQEFFTPMTAPRGAITNYTIDESGFMLPIVISITAYLFWRQRASRASTPAYLFGPAASATTMHHRAWVPK